MQAALTPTSPSSNHRHARAASAVIEAHSCAKPGYGDKICPVHGVHDEEAPCRPARLFHGERPRRPCPPTPPWQLGLYAAPGRGVMRTIVVGEDGGEVLTDHLRMLAGVATESIGRRRL